MRKVITNIDQMIDIMSSIKGGVFAKIGYITTAKIGKTAQGLNVDKFGKDLDKNRTEVDDDIYNKLRAYQQGGAKRSNKFPYKGIIKYSTFQVNWQTEENYLKNYNKYATERDKILASFGATPNRRDSYDEKINYNKGVSVGTTDNTKGKLYSHQNGATILNRNVKYFLVDDNGEIQGSVPEKAIQELIKSNNPIDGVAALNAINASKEQIEDYIAQLKKLKFHVLKLMYDSILFIIITVNGEKIAYINNGLKNQVGSGSYVAPIQPQSFINMANEMFKEADSSLQESVKHYNVAKSYINEVVKKTLSEVRGWTIEDDDYIQVNPNEADFYNDCYIVKIWCGMGYSLSTYKVYANHEQEALDICVAWLEDNDPSMLQDEIYQRCIEDGDSEDELDTIFMYVDATMEGASEPHYIYAENLKIYKCPNQTHENQLHKTVKKIVKEALDSIGEETEEYNPWMNGDASYFNGQFDCNGYDVEIDTQYVTVSIINKANGEETFLQDQEACELIEEICQYWADNDCNQCQAIDYVINLYF